MRKVDDGEEKEKEKKKRKEKRKEKKEKNGVFSGHYVIASSLPPERLRPKDAPWNAARLCQFHIHPVKAMFFIVIILCLYFFS